MKKLLLIAVFAATTGNLFGQVTLTKGTHGFMPDLKNPMVLTNYIEPGTSGKNVIWDFSKLNVLNSFTGSIDNFYTSKCCNKFTKGNVVLEEFGNYFVFESTEQSLEQVGFLSSNGNTIYEYNKPFVKMRYPFTYGDIYSGSYKGNYLINDNYVGKIYGTYTVEADGIGRIILPEGKKLDNALRVKEIRKTKNIFTNNTISQTDITYRWYVPQHRFPVLVLIRSEVTSGSTQEPVISTRAAYNGNVMNVTLSDLNNSDDNLNLNIYPNPYTDYVNIKFNMPESNEVNISIYDLSGRMVMELENRLLESGAKEYRFSAKANGLSAGAYILKVKIGQLGTTRKLIELNQ